MAPFLIVFVRLLEEILSSKPDLAHVAFAREAARRLSVEIPRVVGRVVRILQAEADRGVGIIDEVYDVVLRTLDRTRAGRASGGRAGGASASEIAFARLAHVRLHLAVVETHPDRIGEVECEL
jgi:hypothetical protein